MAKTKYEPSISTLEGETVAKTKDMPRQEQMVQQAVNRSANEE